MSTSSNAHDEPSASHIASIWLTAFVAALTSGSGDITSHESFLDDGWLRDSLTLSWNNRSLRGQQAISHYIASNREKAISLDPRSFALDQDADELRPHFASLTPRGKRGVTFGFRFGSQVVRGRGFARLLPVDGAVKTEERWKALTVYLSVVALVGYEEAGSQDLEGTSYEVRRKEDDESNPDVVVVGAGHSGLSIAACLKKMGKRVLILEKNARVGDNWRNRYATLALHTVKSASPFLYQPYPSNWPVYASKDKIADFIESYAVLQDLTIWTSSILYPGPKYDPASSTWEIYVDKSGGSIVRLNPRHLIFATGIACKPIIPDIPGGDAFRGLALHSKAYRNGEPFRGKRVVVVGAGNTAADICQDIYAHHSAFNGQHEVDAQKGSVTMVQRSETCVITRESLAKKSLRAWPDSPTVNPDVCAFLSASLPFLLLKEWEIDRQDEAWKENEEIHEGLRKVGFRLTMGKEGEGQFILAYERGGGFWVDVGCASLISSSKVKLKQSEVERFTSDGLLFKDGSHLPADVVIFATGYESGRASVKEIFGPDVLQHLPPVGESYMDSEGETAGMYRPTGYPGLWFAMGSFSQARGATERLAILIQASDAGLLDH